MRSPGSAPSAQSLARAPIVSRATRAPNESDRAFPGIPEPYLAKYRRQARLIVCWQQMVRSVVIDDESRRSVRGHGFRFWAIAPAPSVRMRERRAGCSSEWFRGAVPSATRCISAFAHPPQESAWSASALALAREPIPRSSSGHTFDGLMVSVAAKRSASVGVVVPFRMGEPSYPAGLGAGVIGRCPVLVLRLGRFRRSHGFGSSAPPVIGGALFVARDRRAMPCGLER